MPTRRPGILLGRSPAAGTLVTPRSNNAPGAWFRLAPRQIRGGGAAFPGRAGRQTHGKKPENPFDGETLTTNLGVGAEVSATLLPKRTGHFKKQPGTMHGSRLPITTRWRKIDCSRKDYTSSHSSNPPVFRLRRTSETRKPATLKAAAVLRHLAEECGKRRTSPWKV